MSYPWARDKWKELSLHFLQIFADFATFLLQKIGKMAGIETPSTVSVQITSSMTSFTSEKRLQRGETISALKVTCVWFVNYAFMLWRGNKISAVFDFYIPLFQIVVINETKENNKETGSNKLKLNQIMLHNS